MNEYIKKAIELAGSQQRLADKIGVTQRSVSTWLHDRIIPINRAIQIERVTQGTVTREDLRPDIFSIKNKDSHA
jgi:DNA-binding transcriptional regulator YdaS (Cro superfamily)